MWLCPRQTRRYLQPRCAGVTGKQAVRLRHASQLNNNLPHDAASGIRPCQSRSMDQPASLATKRLHRAEDSRRNRALQEWPGSRTMRGSSRLTLRSCPMSSSADGLSLNFTVLTNNCSGNSSNTSRAARSSADESPRTAKVDAQRRDASMALKASRFQAIRSWGTSCS